MLNKIELISVKKEAFPGMMVIFCALTISFAILIIWFSFDMIDGIKMVTVK
jgi:hypothetical protein